MTLAQLDLFEEPDVSELKAKIAEIEARSIKDSELLRKIQKKLFGAHGDMVKMLLELLHRIEQLEVKKDESNYE